MGTLPQWGTVLVSLFQDGSEQAALKTQLNAANQKMQQIINAIPGGVAVYKVTDKLETVYFSDGVPALSGYTSQEYLSLIHIWADIYNSDLIDFLTRILKKYELQPSRLHLEITESAYTENPGQIIATVEQLRTLGFVIEMDDFGSGYSSLNMLNQLPLDILKLDMKFIQNETAKPVSYTHLPRDRDQRGRLRRPARVPEINPYPASASSD